MRCCMRAHMHVHTQMKIELKPSACDIAAPRIEIESPAYSVHEPESVDDTSILTVKVVRYGDKDKTLKARCSTRDGSAISGLDYNARSKVLTFAPGSCQYLVLLLNQIGSVQ